MKIYVATVKALRKKERWDETGGKTSLGPSYFVLQNFIPSYTFDALYDEIDHSHSLIAGLYK